MGGGASFGPERRKRLVSRAIPRTRQRAGDLSIEIIRDRRSPGIVHYVVQKKGSREILNMGQARSIDQAQATADAFLEDHLRQRKRMA